MKRTRQRQWSCVARCKCPGWCVPLDGRTRKSGGRVTRSDQLHHLRWLILAGANPHPSAGPLMLFLEKCPAPLLHWLAEAAAEGRRVLARAHAGLSSDP